jgi:hypothetical protein
VTLAVVSTRAGVKPAAVSWRASDIEKQPASAMPMCASGLVSSSGWMRLARVKLSAGVDSPHIWPTPSVSVPSQRAMPWWATVRDASAGASSPSPGLMRCASARRRSAARDGERWPASTR